MSAPPCAAPSVCILFINHTAARLNRQKHVRLKARDFIFSRQILAAHINSVTPHALRPAADLLARGSDELYHLLPCVEVLNGVETAAYTWSPALYRQSQGYQSTDWHQRAGLLSTNWNETMLSRSAVGLPVSNRYHYRKVHYYLKKTTIRAIYWRPLE